jgi:hypothetical protein
MTCQVAPFVAAQPMRRPDNLVGSRGVRVAELLTWWFGRAGPDKSTMLMVKGQGHETVSRMSTGSHPGAVMVTSIDPGSVGRMIASARPSNVLQSDGDAVDTYSGWSGPTRGLVTIVEQPGVPTSSR